MFAADKGQKLAVMEAAGRPTAAQIANAGSGDDLKAGVRPIGAPPVLNRRDLAIGTAIALVMMVVFVKMSSGLSLIVTFVPGLAFAWIVFFWMYRRKIALPDAAHFMPLFFAALAIQFLHFAEEFNTGFATEFPELYGGTAYSAGFFVAFNMVSYAIFTASCLLVFLKGARFLLVPVLFYVVYGAIGNAVTHTWWVVESQAYFPGFVTAQAYWIAGPWLLYKLMGARAPTALVVVTLAITLVATVTIFAFR